MNKYAFGLCSLQNVDQNFNKKTTKINIFIEIN